MSLKLHEVVGRVSAASYVAASVVAVITFMIFQYIKMDGLVEIHAIAVFVAVLAAVGMIVWWIMEMCTND